MEEKITLKKVNIIGEKFFHVFEDTFGNEVEVETTETDYRQLGSKTPNNPKKDNLTWKHSYSDFSYDTPTSKLTNGFYARNGNKYRLVANDVEILDFELADIVEDKVIKVKIDSIVADFNRLKT